jgi:hypothetical protein
VQEVRGVASKQFLTVTEPPKCNSNDETQNLDPAGMTG